MEFKPKILTPFKRAVIQQFPFIEEDFDALTNYGLLCKIVEYLNNLLNSQNEVNEQTVALTNAFNELKTFIDDYFENLDVQEQINNKLDQMAEDGSLEEILRVYFEPEVQRLDTKIDEGYASLDTRINNLVEEGVAPIAVSSTSEMTDTSKVYVNTTNGKWYYYDGDSWEIGGDYQAVAIGDGTVTYNTLSKLSNNEKYSVLHAEDLVWRTGYAYVNGGMSVASGAICSAPVRMSKGSTITIDSAFYGRITYWNLDGSYISNTGTNKAITNEVVPSDCFVGISFRSEPEGTDVTLSDITNANITLVGLSNNKFSFVRESLTVYRTTASTTRLQTNMFYAGKGSKFWISGKGIKNSSNNYSETVVYIRARLYEKDRTTNFSTIDFALNSVITLPKDCYVELYFQKRGAATIEDSEIANFTNFLEIDYVKPNDREYPDYKVKSCYIGANDTIEIVNNVNSGGHILVTWTGTITLYDGGTELFDYTVNDVLTALNSEGVSYMDKTWIDIPNQQMLWYNLFTDTFAINSYRSSRLDCLVYPLLKNSYNNPFEGALLSLKNRNNSEASEIFNSTLWYDSVDWKAPAKAFNALVNTTDKIESYCFFTDPHCMGTAEQDQSPSMQKRIALVEKVYNSTATSFIVSGGDWLNSRDTNDAAAFKLGYIDGFTNALFKDFYPVLGNHDTNYLGSSGAPLDNAAITNLMFRKWGKNYYSFDGINSKNYVLDNARDNDYQSMDSYRWEQLKWFGDKIKADDPEHATVFTHLIWRENTNFTIGVMADNITKLIAAYNAHTTITLNSVNYDFTSCTGHIDYVMSGHTHLDKSGSVNGVLCIATLNLGAGTPSFDLVLNNYTQGTVKLVRVGSGSNQEFNI